MGDEPNDGALARLPGNAYDDTELGVLKSTRELLHGLNLLPTEDELKKSTGATALLGGSDPAVAVIESGATALAKYWAAGLGAALATVWASVAKFWGQNDDKTNVQVTLLGGGFFATAALVIAISVIISSDIRGRAAATVATVNARFQVASAVVGVAKEGPAKEGTGTATSLPAGLTVRVPGEAGEDNDDGWLALATRQAGTASDGIEMLVARGSTTKWVKASTVRFPG